MPPLTGGVPPVATSAGALEIQSVALLRLEISGVVAIRPDTKNV
jgi:hypothetical protein